MPWDAAAPPPLATILPVQEDGDAAWTQTVAVTTKFDQNDVFQYHNVIMKNGCFLTQCFLSFGSLKISKGLKIPKTVTANFLLKQPEKKKTFFFAACFHAEGKENGKNSLFLPRPIPEKQAFTFCLTHFMMFFQYIYKRFQCMCVRTYVHTYVCMCACT